MRESGGSRVRGVRRRMECGGKTGRGDEIEGILSPLFSPSAASRFMQIAKNGLNNQILQI